MVDLNNRMVNSKQDRLRIQKKMFERKVLDSVIVIQRWFRGKQGRTYFKNVVLREREEEKAKLAKLLKEMHSKVQEVLGKSN